MRAFQIAGPQSGCKAICCVVRQLQRLFFCVEWLESHHWPKNLLLVRSAIRSQSFKDSWCDVKPILHTFWAQSTSTTQHASAFFTSHVNARQNLVHVCLRYHCTKFGGWVERVTGNHLRSLFHKSISESIVDGALHQDAGSAQTDLTLIGKRTSQRCPQRLFEVRIIKNDGGVFAPQLEAHLLEPRRDVSRDARTSGCSTREGNCSNVRVGHHGLAHFWPKSMQNTEHSVRESGILDPCA